MLQNSRQRLKSLFRQFYNCHIDIITESFYITTWAIISLTFPIKVLLAAFKPNIKCRSGHLSPLHAVQSLSTKELHPSSHLTCLACFPTLLNGPSDMSVKNRLGLLYRATLRRYTEFSVFVCSL